VLKNLVVPLTLNLVKKILLVPTPVLFVSVPPGQNGNSPMVIGIVILKTLINVLPIVALLLPPALLLVAAITLLFVQTPIVVIQTLRLWLVCT